VCGHLIWKGGGAGGGGNMVQRVANYRQVRSTNEIKKSYILIFYNKKITFFISFHLIAGEKLCVLRVVMPEKQNKIKIFSS